MWPVPTPECRAKSVSQIRNVVHNSLRVLIPGRRRRDETRFRYTMKPGDLSSVDGIPTDGTGSAEI